MNWTRLRKYRPKIKYKFTSALSSCEKELNVKFKYYKIFPIAYIMLHHEKLYMYMRILGYNVRHIITLWLYTLL